MALALWAMGLAMFTGGYYEHMFTVRLVL